MPNAQPTTKELIAMLYERLPELFERSQQKPLTDEQIEQCMKQAYATVQGRNLEHAFARAIEAAHGIKE